MDAASAVDRIFQRSLLRSAAPSDQPLAREDSLLRRQAAVESRPAVFTPHKLPLSHGQPSSRTDAPHVQRIVTLVQPTHAPIRLPTTLRFTGGDAAASVEAAAAPAPALTMPAAERGQAAADVGAAESKGAAEGEDETEPPSDFVPELEQTVEAGAVTRALASPSQPPPPSVPPAEAPNADFLAATANALGLGSIAAMLRPSQPPRAGLLPSATAAIAAIEPPPRVASACRTGGARSVSKLTRDGSAPSTPHTTPWYMGGPTHVRDPIAAPADASVTLTAERETPIREKRARVSTEQRGKKRQPRRTAAEEESVDLFAEDW